jgi:hypothetical protein
VKEISVGTPFDSGAGLHPVYILFFFSWLFPKMIVCSG